MADRDSLTGVWHGLYTYTTQPQIPESHFVCILIESSGRLMGTIHESMNHSGSSATDENAVIEGIHDAGAISFIKTYDGSGARSHSVAYSGNVNASRDEIEGTWTIAAKRRNLIGRFLMIRKRGEKQEHKSVLHAGHDMPAF